MEDWNGLAADCVVISCCCQCLIIQILVFIVLQFPRKLVRKIKGCLKTKLGYRKREKGVEREEIGCGHGKRENGIEREKGQCKDEIIGIQIEGFSMNECCDCMEEVEKVLEDLSQKGEFAFGSFWGKKESERLPTNVAQQEFENNVVLYEFIEMFDPISDAYAIAGLKSHRDGDAKKVSRLQSS